MAHVRSVAAALVAFALPVLVSCVERDEAVWAHVEGDVGPSLAALDTAEMRVHARAFLASDRPWRAAQAMRRYLEQAPGAPAEDRVLAARAEAGWGGWGEVLSLLDAVPALDTHEDGMGLYLLGRARDEAGDPAGAEGAYRAFLAMSPPAGELERERAAARLRLGLALVRAGEREAARAELSLSSEEAGSASLWIDLLEAAALAHTGDLAAVQRTVARFDAGIPGLHAWRARIEAARRADDPAGARTLANQARAWARTDVTRAEFLVAAGKAAVDMGDVAAGRQAFRSAVELSAATPWARRAAALLLDGAMTPPDHLAVARVHRAQGLHEEALDGYRRWLDSGLGALAERAEVRLEYATALFYAERYDEVEAALAPIAAQVTARQLRARAEAHLGNVDEAVRIYLALAGELAGTSDGAQALLLAAATRHDEGDLGRARELYRRVADRYAGGDQAGLATMRLAGIAFLEGEHAEAARLWNGYRSRHPRGPLALQATYWAGRAREETGDSAGAAGLYRSVLQQGADSYYALLASDRLGEPFWPPPLGATPPADAGASRRVAGWMRGIDLLRNAGFLDEASAEADRAVERAGSDRPILYALAEALAERGYSQRAIRIGLRLQAVERPNRRLLLILYPFPHRTLITEEARDRSLDPFVAAALIRQESLFEARITSPAGARGLMQIMPSTGRRLADAAGVDPWDAEILYHPEINVHLGMRYVAQHMESYDRSLPAVFAAYNAGAHRVAWWAEFPEYGQGELFTERIPFRETRDYVKTLTRNLAIYRGLYGGAG